VKPGDAGFTYATADTVLDDGDVLVVAGPSDACESFARLSR
jgi:trk system potassium uptake protein TrkA